MNLPFQPEQKQMSNGQSNSRSHNNWLRCELIYSGDEYFNQILDLIDSAKSEIQLEVYIFDMDAIGKRVLDALKRAQARGVSTHLLVDGIGSYTWGFELRDFCQKNKIHFYIFHPFWLQTFKNNFFRWKSLSKLAFLFRAVNKRNHRKTLLIDQRIALLGSFNITVVHSEEFAKAHAWRDTGILVEGPDVQILKRSFFQAASRFSHRRFFGARSLYRPRQMMKRIRLNSFWRWRVSLINDLKRRLKNAKTHIYVTNAYFVPRRAFLRHLRKAARRGVFVGLCLPAKTDVPIVQWASRSLYYRLLKAGVHIYEYQPRILHAKTLMIDSWATVGSHNLNHRSFLHDLEVEAVVEEPRLLQSLKDQWDKDIAQSKEITFEEIGRFPWYQRLLCQVAYWLRYWM